MVRELVLVIRPILTERLVLPGADPEGRPRGAIYFLTEDAASSIASCAVAVPVAIFWSAVDTAVE